MSIEIIVTYVYLRHIRKVIKTKKQQHSTHLLSSIVCCADDLLRKLKRLQHRSTVEPVQQTRYMYVHVTSAYAVLIFNTMNEVIMQGNSLFGIMVSNFADQHSFC